MSGYSSSEDSMDYLSIVIILAVASMIAGLSPRSSLQIKHILYSSVILKASNIHLAKTKI